LVEVRTVDTWVLRDAVGGQADWLRRLANGIDDRPVTPNRTVKSSGSENTYPEDLTDLETIREQLGRMARRGADWLERKALRARTVTIKVRYSDFTTVTRSHSERPATRNADRIVARARLLLGRTEAGTRPVRLLGVSLHNLSEPDNERPANPPLPL
jgi:DNA polymerase-4